MTTLSSAGLNFKAVNDTIYSAVRTQEGQLKSSHRRDCSIWRWRGFASPDVGNATRDPTVDNDDSNSN